MRKQTFSARISGQIGRIKRVPSFFPTFPPVNTMGESGAPVFSEIFSKQPLKATATAPTVKLIEVGRRNPKAPLLFFVKNTML